MAFENLRTQAQVGSGTYAGAVDQGLRQHLLRVYNYMTSGLVVTGLVAWAMYSLSFVTEGGSVVGVTALGAAVLEEGSAAQQASPVESGRDSSMARTVPGLRGSLGPQHSSLTARSPSLRGRASALGT